MSTQFSDDAVTTKIFEIAENVAAMKERLEDLPGIKEKVEKHERAYNVAKYAAVPAMTAFHVSLRSLLQKIGW